MTRIAIEEQAARWLLRREEAGWSGEDAAALDRWLDEATAHRVAFLRLEHGWRQVGRLAALRTPEAPMMAPPAGARRRRAVARWRPAALAAGFALALALGGLAANGWLIPGRKVYETEVGGHSTVPLADGSKVELNTDSRVRTAVTKERRLVWLDRGEAFFDVAHDASRPFVVMAGDRRITVLGTRFSVRRSSDGRVSVNVLNGRVRVEAVNAAPQSPPALITAGERLIAEDRATLVAPPSAEKVSAELAWRRGLLIFDQTTLGEAAAEFNRYNRRKIVIDDPAVAGVRIGGSFDAENIDAFVRLLREGFGLKIEEDQDRYRVSN
jgi:transmembrane sensor